MPSRYIVCADCGKEFAFSEKDQRFYKDKGFKDPRRCPECRKKRREAKSLGGN